MLDRLAPSHRVALTVDSLDWSGWTAISITLSMEQASGTFELVVSEQWEGFVRRLIGPGAGCAVAIDGETVIRGWVDEVAPSYDAATHALAIRGRDATGDLVDCSVLPPFEYRGLTLTEIARRVASPFRVAVRADVDVGAPFERFAIQPGETAWEAIERAARMRGVLAMADGKGGLLLTRAGTASAPAPLVLGGNVKAGSGTFTHVERFSAYHVLGQQEGSDLFGDAVEAAAPSAIVADPDVRRYRPTILLGEAAGDGVSLKTRAEWQKAVHQGRSKRAVYTVQGWRAAGALWRPNAKVTVIDRWVNLDGEELLIPRVTFRLSEAGTETEIEVAPASAYLLEPEGSAEAKAASAGKKSATSGARRAERSSSGSGPAGKAAAGSSGGDDPFSLWGAK